MRDEKQQTPCACGADNERGHTAGCIYGWAHVTVFADGAWVGPEQLIFLPEPPVAVLPPPPQKVKE